MRGISEIGGKPGRRRRLPTKRNSHSFRNLPKCSFYVLFVAMLRLTQASIATTLLRAPGWARVGLTAPTERLRDDAANELARAILEEIGEGYADAPGPDQLRLTL